ncbi:hypothetical protein VNO77_38880 [Canavalia gladiata]|uniref:Uncharacterized protein n=1 Tax=Canavalia gladiata TaxID=3824 RepID=A0AAN9KCK5_CANGL
MANSPAHLRLGISRKDGRRPPCNDVVARTFGPERLGSMGCTIVSRGYAMSLELGYSSVFPILEHLRFVILGSRPLFNVFGKREFFRYKLDMEVGVRLVQLTGQSKVSTRAGALMMETLFCILQDLLHLSSSAFGNAWRREKISSSCTFLRQLSSFRKKNPKSPFSKTPQPSL